jgi:putative molybdopterin biosynthesis protein
LQVRTRARSIGAVKRARPPLPSRALAGSDALLTTGDVANLLRVHPKHVYRLLRRGLPGHRVGGEWRFLAAEVLRWSGAPRASPAEALADPAEGPSNSARAPGPPPLLAANGDVAVERLLGRMKDGPTCLGFVQADRGGALDLLRQGSVLVAGCHGSAIPGMLDGHRLAFIHLVDRQVGLVVRAGVRIRSLRNLGRWRLASRPETAGIRTHFDVEARRQGLDPRALHARAMVLPSHREVVCAVARGEADVGLSSVAWGHQVGLRCVPLCRETYGVLVRASLLGDPRIVRLCEVAQSAAFRQELGEVPGYDAELSGVIAYQPSTNGPS